MDRRPLDRFVSYMNTDVLDLSLLKCHLLVEEALLRIIERHVQKPALVTKARLGFAQKLTLARAMSTRGVEEWVWEAAGAMNEARNKVAHTLDGEAMGEKVEAFMLLVARAASVTPTSMAMPRTAFQFQFAAFLTFMPLAMEADWSSALEIPTAGLHFNPPAA